MKYVGVSSPAYTILGKPKTLIKKNSISNIKNNFQNIKYDLVEQNYPKWKFSSKNYGENNKEDNNNKNNNKNIIDQKFQHCDLDKTFKKHENRDKIMTTSKRYDFVNQKNEINKIEMNEKTNIIEGIQYSFGYKYDDFNNELENYKKNIGPGKYNIKHNMIDKKTKTFYFSKSKKEKKIFKTKLPGPGHYNILNENDKKHEKLKKKFENKNLKIKGVFDNNNSNPGPGHYIVKYSGVEIKRNGLVFNEKKKKILIDPNIPGPGTYEAKNLIGNNYSKNAVFGKAPRIKENLINKKNNFLEEFKKKEDIKISKNMKKESKISYSVKKNNKEKFITPGPGHYKYNIDLKYSLPKYSIRGRTKIKEKSTNIPSPGKYDTFYDTKNSKHYSFGKSKRFNVSFNQNEKKWYDVRGNLQNTNGIKFPKAKRYNINNEDNEIGPGYYNLKPTLPNTQPWLYQDVNENTLKIHL